MKSAYVNLVRLLSVLSLSFLLFLTVSAQTDSTVTGETNSSDAMAIQLLVDTFFGLPALSVGDPCLPEPYSWVKCSSDDTPRITEINLHNSIVGTDLPDFSAMDALEKIDLGANILLAMEFPDFLANFPKLKVLYLVGTSIFGTVPTSLKKRSDSKTLKLMLPATGLCFSDEDVCPAETETGTETGIETSPGTDEETSTTSFTPTRTKSRKKKTVPIALGTGIPIFVIFWAVVGFLASAAQNILPDDQGINTDGQTHPTV
ncbi:hypothetical protein MKX01_030009 [Papaver californicum]|nr:hypothetical protein MKX01_030009 [Papaver californicum]